MVAAQAILRQVRPCRRIAGLGRAGAQQRGPVGHRQPAGRAGVVVIGDGVVAADEVGPGIGIDVFHHQVIELAGLHGLGAAEVHIGKQRAAVFHRGAGGEDAFGQWCGVQVRQVLRAAVIGQQAQADAAVVAGRIAIARLPVQAHGRQVAVDGGTEAVGHHLLLPLVDAHYRVAQPVLPVHTRAVEALKFGRGEGVALLAGLQGAL